MCNMKFIIHIYIFSKYKIVFMKCNWNLLAAFCFKILTLTHNSTPTYKRLNRHNLCRFKTPFAVEGK